MLTLSQFIYSIIIGIVQGVSEWLPISSKTQVLVASQYLLGLSFSQAYTFGLFMEIGTVLAAIIYFRKELLGLVEVLLGSKDADARRLFAYVLIATVATGIVGTPLYLIADSITGVSVGIPMLVIGIVLIFDAIFISYSRKKHRQQKNAKKLSDLGVREYVVIGVAQGIAALPGVSRSGITTSTMLLMDVEADEAFRLSFLVGIFASVAAFGLTLFASSSNVGAALSSISPLGLLVAIVTATLISLFLIDFLIKVAGRSSIVYLTGALGIIALAGGLLYITLGI